MPVPYVWVLCGYIKYDVKGKVLPVTGHEDPEGE